MLLRASLSLFLAIRTRIVCALREMRLSENRLIGCGRVCCSWDARFLSWLITSCCARIWCGELGMRSAARNNKRLPPPPVNLHLGADKVNKFSSPARPPTCLLLSLRESRFVFAALHRRLISVLASSETQAFAKKHSSPARTLVPIWDWNRRQTPTTNRTDAISARKLFCLMYFYYFTGK